MLLSEAGAGIHKGDIVLDLDSATINGVRHQVASSDIVQTSAQAHHCTALAAIGEVTTHGKRVYVPAETTLTFSLEQALVLRPRR